MLYILRDTNTFQVRRDNKILSTFVVDRRVLVLRSVRSQKEQNLVNKVMFTALS